MSDNVFVTKGLLSLASFIHGFVYILIVKFYGCCKGEASYICWTQPDRDGDGKPIEGTYRLRKGLLAVMMVRGLFEFAGSFLLLLSLKIALDNSMNQGISTSMMSLAGLMVTLLSWCIYKEKLTWPQFVGMGTILLAVVCMGIF